MKNKSAWDAHWRLEMSRSQCFDMSQTSAQAESSFIIWIGGAHSPRSTRGCGSWGQKKDYNDLTWRPKPHRWWLDSGESSPFMAELFRLVKYSIYPEGWSSSIFSRAISVKTRGYGYVWIIITHHGTCRPILTAAIHARQILHQRNPLGFGIPPFSGLVPWIGLCAVLVMVWPGDRMLYACWGYTRHKWDSLIFQCARGIWTFRLEDPPSILLTLW